MKYCVLTIFPGMFSGFLRESIIGKAVEQGLINVDIVNIRTFAEDKHLKVDDSPYGGGPGMVMKPEPLSKAIVSAKRKLPGAKVVAMTPQGKPFSQQSAMALAEEDSIILLCGRYEGIDERIFELHVDMEFSIGDYVLTGGELPAMTIMDAVSRYVPGVLGSENSVSEESFAQGRLEYPHYTRPFEYKGLTVPEVLLSGNHGAVRKWRRCMSLVRTMERRPDLFEEYPLMEDEKKILAELFRRLEEFVRK